LSVWTARGDLQRIRLKNGGGKTKSGSSRNTTIQLMHHMETQLLLTRKNIIHDLQIRSTQVVEDALHDETLQNRILTGNSALCSGDLLGGGHHVGALSREIG